VLFAKAAVLYSFTEFEAVAPAISAATTVKTKLHTRESLLS